MSLETDVFDLFSGKPDRDALWLEAVEGLEIARRRIAELARLKPGPYFIFHSSDHAIMGTIDTAAPAASAQSGDVDNLKKRKAG